MASKERVFGDKFLATVDSIVVDVRVEVVVEVVVVVFHFLLTF